METRELSRYYNMIDNSIPENAINWFVENQLERINKLWLKYDFENWDYSGNLYPLYSAVKSVFEQPLWVIRAKELYSDLEMRDKTLNDEIDYRKSKFQEWECDFQDYIDVSLNTEKQTNNIKMIFLFLDRLIYESKEVIKIYKIDFLGTPLTQYFIESLIYYKSRIDSFLGETKLLDIENLIQVYEVQKEKERDEERKRRIEEKQKHFEENKKLQEPQPRTIKENEIRKLFDRELNIKHARTTQTKGDRLISSLKIDRTSIKEYARIAQIMFVSRKITTDKCFKDWLPKFYVLIGIENGTNYKPVYLEPDKELKQEFDYL